jgi:amidase
MTCTAPREVSSGGSGASMSANFCTVALGREGFASIRRSAAWKGVVGIAPNDWYREPQRRLRWLAYHERICRSHDAYSDAAKLLDSMAGYPLNPATAYGVDRIAESYPQNLNRDALRGKRLGTLRTPTDYKSDPSSGDFKKVDGVFDHAIIDLGNRGVQACRNTEPHRASLDSHKEFTDR